MDCRSRYSPCESSPPLPFAPVPRMGEENQKCQHLSLPALLSDNQWNHDILILFTLRSCSSARSFFIFSNSARRAAVSSSSLSSSESSSSSSYKYKNSLSTEDLKKVHNHKLVTAAVQTLTSVRGSSASRLTAGIWSSLGLFDEEDDDDDVACSGKSGLIKCLCG